jgi:hypothetical protein
VQQCEAQIIYTSLAPRTWPRCEHIEYSADFSFQTQIFVVFLNFHQQNPLENEYLPHPLSSENCEINSIKSDLPRAFQLRHEWPQISIQFSVSILFNFRWENDSIINRFHTIAPNNLKPSRCTLTQRELFKDTKSECNVKPHDLRDLRITKWNKTNYLAS